MKKTLCIFLVLIQIIVGCNTALASDKEYIEVQQDSLISSIFTSDSLSNSSEYKILDINGNNVTNSFLSIATSYIENNDWQSLKAVCELFDVKSIQRTVCINSFISRSGDIGKTVEDTYYEIMYDSTGSDNIEVATELRGTFYYNPNTFVISQVSKPIMTYIAISYASANVEYSTPILVGTKSGNYNAHFTCSFNVTDHIIYQNTHVIDYDYGTYVHSFYASVDD